MTESTEIIVVSNPLALMGDVTLESVQKDFAPVREWRYSFPQKGTTVEGLSADGVQDGVRQMARQGEAIRTLDVRLEKDTDKEAFFIAHAARYAISPDGKEILLDSTIRAKRVPKFDADGAFNKFWFEHGVTKAARNAEEALMPEALKQWMITQARGLTVPQRSQAAPQRPVQAPPRPRPAPPQPDPDAIPFDPPAELLTEGQQKAIEANGRMLAWTTSQLAANIEEFLQEGFADHDWSTMPASQGKQVLSWQKTLLKAKGKSAVEVE